MITWQEKDDDDDDDDDHHHHHESVISIWWWQRSDDIDRDEKQVERLSRGEKVCPGLLPHSLL